jgi:hypothetical protein
LENCIRFSPASRTGYNLLFWGGRNELLRLFVEAFCV